MADQVTTDLAPEDLAHGTPCDRLVIGDSGEHHHFGAGQVYRLRRRSESGLQDAGIAGAPTKLPAARDGNKVIGAVAKLGADVLDDQVDAAVATNETAEHFSAGRLRRGKDDGLYPGHPFAPAKLLGQIGQVPINSVLQSALPGHDLEPVDLEAVAAA